jgi:hypothetical protein
VVASFDTVADTGDGMLTDGEHVETSITQILVGFDEALAEAAAEDLANWSLVEAGADGTIETTGCGVDPADIDAGPNASTLLADQQTVRLDVGGGLALPTGSYRLLVCSGITDEAGNSIGASEVDFTVTSTNVVPNPNFDDTIVPWAVGGSRPSAVKWGIEDLQSKATSGSLEISIGATSGGWSSAATCIELPPATPAVFGGAFEVEGGVGTDPLVTAIVQGSTLPACAALTTTNSTVLAEGATAGWQPLGLSLPGAWASVEVRFEVAHDASSNHAVRFDLVGLDGPLFADGFESGNTSAWSAQVP